MQNKLKKIFGKIKREGLINAIQNYVDKEATLKKELKIIRDYHLINEEERKQQKEFKFECEEKISIITPLYNTPKDFLIQLIDSVEKQTYSNWELCLADGSDLDHEYVREICMKYMEADNRIIYKKLEENEGIVGNTNKAIQMATGTYLGLLDHDDILHESALYECMKEIQNSADFIYTDEMKFEKKIEDSIDIVCKSGFGKDELRSHNYICHFVVFKKQLLDNMTEFYRREYEGSQDYDMVLRLTEKAEKIVHIPKILYHWRVHQSSTAENPESKLYAYDAGKRAIEEHLKRVDRAGKVRELYYRGFYHVTYKVKEKAGVTVCFVGNNKTDVKKCMKSIKKTAGKVKCQFIAVKSIKEVKEEQIRYEYVLFVDSSIRMISKNWMREMIGICQFPENGVVGIQLINKKNQTIYHNGFLKGQKGYAFQGQPVEAVGYFHRDELTQCVDGVTDKFMMMRTDLAKEVNCDENTDEREICYTLRKKAKQNVVVPLIKAYV